MPEETKRTVPYKDVQIICPQREYLNNTKLGNCISSISLLPQSAKLEAMTIPKKSISIIVDLKTDKNISLKCNNISRYDMAVMDSVYTMLINGCDVFTPDMVVRVMAGDMKMKVTQQKRDTATESLEKLRMIDIKIDCTNELLARKKIKEGETAVLRNYLLPLSCLSVRSANHKKVFDGYQIIAKPALYEYAEIVRQIISIPIELMPSKSNKSSTDEMIILRREILKIIERMKSPTNNYKSSNITYLWTDAKTGTSRGFFTQMGFTPEDYKNEQCWANKRSDLHKEIVSILDDFVSEEYINGYTVNRERKKVLGVSIDPGKPASESQHGKKQLRGSAA